MTNIAKFSRFPSASKLLIIHADDLGMCGSVNRAIIAALEAGAVNSASIMVPCPGFAEAAEWAARNPEYDLGIHSTLISEWKTLRWGPVSRKAFSSGLTDENGYFWSKNSLLRAPADEVREEISAQIVAAKEAGVEPTHLDSHMLSVARPEYINAYIQTAREFELLFLIDEYWHSLALSQRAAADSDIVVDNLFQAGAGLSPDSLEDYYISVLRDLQPGLSQLLVHPGFDDEELRTITGDRQSYGARWRQQDFDIVMSKRFNSVLKENGIQVVNWGMLKPGTDGRRSSLPLSNPGAV